jgi:hypothetical protein
VTVPFFTIVIVVLALFVFIVLFSTGQVDLGTAAYLREVELNMENVVNLKDRPADFEDSPVYKDFEELMPDWYIKAGNPRIKSVRAWYDAYNIEGIQFTFNNGDSDYPMLFGV